MVVSNTGIYPAAQNSVATQTQNTPMPGDLSMDMDEAMGYSELENVSKAALVRVEVSQLPREIPDFQAPGATKDTLIADWLKNWIVESLQNQTVTENHLMPKKADIAAYLGVSVGTVQNAIRYIEDEGHVESKQRIGTLIRNLDSSGQRMRKQTSKRDQAVVAIKHFIVEQGFQPGQTLPSAREIAKTILSAPNTTRLALEFLSGTGILKSLGNRGNKANWALRVIPDIETESLCAIESETLIDQLERDLKKLVAENFETNDKLPSHLELSDLFKVSIKTVHDAMRRLAEQGILRSKRGRYGTYVVRKPDASKLAPIDTSIFVPAEEVSFYNYEKVEQHLKTLIRQSYKVGDKLPAMGILSKDLDVSSNTIRKALQNLAKEKMVSFSRGRYGGTYVTRIPEGREEEPGGQSFTWVSINPDTVKTYRTNKTVVHS
jgi:DNA-binding GntR family transcriptional regulator